jgi:hypothetical protein
MRKFWEDENNIDYKELLEKILNGSMQVFSLGYLMLYMMLPTSVNQKQTLLNTDEKIVNNLINELNEIKRPPIDFTIILRSILSFNPSVRPSFSDLSKYFEECLNRYQLSVFEPDFKISEVSNQDKSI